MELVVHYQHYIYIVIIIMNIIIFLQRFIFTVVKNVVIILFFLIYNFSCNGIIFYKIVTDACDIRTKFDLVFNLIFMVFKLYIIIE
mgnify:CR=1 FL=1